MSALLLDFAVDPDVALRLGELLPPETERLRLDDLRGLGPRATIARLRRRRFESCHVLVNDFRAQGRWISLLSMAMLARARRRVLLDPSGAERPLTWRSLIARELPFVVRRAVVSARVRRRARSEAREIAPAPGPRSIRPEKILFVRADLTPALRAGGSLAHIRGVIDGLEEHGAAVRFVSPGPVLGFDEDGDRVRLVAPDDRFRLSQELPCLAYNFRLGPRIAEILDGRSADAVYCRHTIGGYAAVRAARARDVPLIVEFNGSEVWIADHWGGGLKHRVLFAEIERRVLQAADLVVAVSAPLRAQLHEAGVADERILVNPNGVNVDAFDPDRFADRREATRQRLGVREGEVLAGFVGTFGPWHGAETLAAAAARLTDDDASRLRFLFIGDGPRRARTEAILREAGRHDRAAFVGLVPQNETPELLATCDLAVSPHVPNPDGTPFFGSPTKLFEYMASGRAIVASDLDQIGTVLEHGRNAWLVPPGDEAELATALASLAADAESRRSLGNAAREDARAGHSWSAHVARILKRLADASS